MNNTEPVDAVITWVDGQDIRHRNKLNEFLLQKGISRPESAEPTRYNQCGEIDFCIRSLLRFTPWIRRIYIVTDAQKPCSLQSGEFYNHPKIKLIDHREIFADYENNLPTFNSLSIESMLWRIKGLADKFIYLNDDCFIIRPLKPTDFFRDNKSVLRGYWKIMSHYKWWENTRYSLHKFLLLRDRKPTPHRLLQEKTAVMAGAGKRFFYLPHVPFALNKKTIADFFSQHPELLASNISHPFRSKEQFWTVSLALHLDILNKNVIFDNSVKDICMHSSFHSVSKIKSKMLHADKSHKLAFICMQSLDLAPPELRAEMLQWLDKKISQPNCQVLPRYAEYPEKTAIGSL